MVNERNGMLLPPEVTPEEVATAIVKWRSLSVEEIRGLRKNAYETWRKIFDADVNYESFAESLVEVAGLGRNVSGLPGDCVPAEHPVWGKGT